MRCKSCGMELETMGGRYYIHPASDTCNEEDGITIVIDYRKYNKWKEKYGVPTRWYTNLKAKVIALKTRFTKTSEK